MERVSGVGYGERKEGRRRMGERWENRERRNRATDIE